MSLFKWNDVELELEMDDYDSQKKYEAAFEKMAETEKKLKKVGTVSELTKGYCDMFYQLYDDIFGAGTGDELFKGKRKISEVDACYEEFIKTVSSQIAEINKTRARMLNKFTPKSNRCSK